MKKSAFPIYVTGGPESGYHPGMSLREYYAGQAMQALAASPFLNPEEGEKRGMTVAKNAVRYADALIAELEGGE